jgi:preflagellin peptidase FlaK
VYRIPVVSPLIVPAMAIALTLLYASYRDVRERRVPFRTWYPMIIIGIPFTAYFYVLLIQGGGALTALPFLALTGLFSTLFYLFARFHLFGGADAWALIFIAILLPAFPVIPLLGLPPLAFFPFSVLINAVVLNLFTPIGILLYNMRNGSRAPFPYMLLGFPVDGDRISESYGFVMEDITDEEGEIHRRFMGIRESLSTMGRGNGRVYTLDMRRKPDEYARERELYRRAGRVWISYGVPFIVPITFGLVSALLIGDVIFGLLEIVTGG